MHLFRRLTVPAAGVVLLSVLAVAPAGAADVLLSQGKPVKTSSAETSSLSGDKAVDGVGTTRWASAVSTGSQWLRVDLGRTSTVRRVKLDWEAAYAKKYRVEISDDDVTYKTVTSVDNGDGKTDDLTAFAASGRYLRVVGVTRATQYGYSLWELQVFGAGGSTGDTQVPSTPAGLTASSATVSSVVLRWSPSTDNSGVTGYDVLRDGRQAGTASGTTYTDTGLSPDTSYSYTVRARDAAGNISADGTAVTVKTKSVQGKWPGDAAVSIVDGTSVFGTNLSGLSFQGTDVLWAVKNGPGTLYRLVRDGAGWRPDTANGWSSGKALRYKNGSGDPDGEGVVSTPDGLVVATERDGDNSSKSSLKVLRYDVSSSSRTLNAAAEWDLTRDLPSVSDNSGLEAISWVPDSFLTANSFRDEHTNAAYDPASYKNHGSGLYFVGLEDNGAIYAYALDQAGGTYTKVATISSGFPQLMDLEFEAETGSLWAVCDDNCQGKSATLQLSAGRFAVSAVYDRPSQMPDYNNEGFAIAPAASCAAGKKQVVWADDDNDDSHALRAGTLPCSGK